MTDRIFTDGLYYITAIDLGGVRRDLWCGKSLREAIRQQNVRLPAKYRTLYRDYALEERPNP